MKKFFKKKKNCVIPYIYIYIYITKKLLAPNYISASPQSEPREE